MRPPSLAEQAADQIRHRIVKGDFRLGEALSETALAAELGISKTPVREAFLLLKTEGLVDILPQRGTFVFRIGAGEADKLSEFREVLEISALQLAMAKDAAGLGQALGAIAADMSAALDVDDAAAYLELDGSSTNASSTAATTTTCRGPTRSSPSASRRCATGWRWIPRSMRIPSSSTTRWRG